MSSNKTHNSSYQGNQRLTGFARYKELISMNWKTLFYLNIFTIIAFIPFIIGIAAAIMSQSIIVLFINSTISGFFVGPALSGIYDGILRIMRDAPGKWTKNYLKAIKQNFKQSIIPGIIFCTLLSSFIFMAMLMLWSRISPTSGTIFLYLFCIIIALMIFPIYWIQLVLFNQNAFIRLKNCILFLCIYFFKTVGIGLIQALWWGLIILFLPWTSIIIISLGIWYILFLTCFILYTSLNNAFKIEEQIYQTYPEQIPEYGDEEWLKRKTNI